MDKFTLYFKVNHQIIFLENATEVVSQSKNYINAHFSFSKEWDDMLKTAIFKRGTLVFHVLIDENNDCIVPYEVMEEAGAFEVSVFAGELITAVACTVKVLKSGYEAGGAPSEPTPTVYEQIIKMLEEIEAGDVPQEKIDEAVENYLSTHPIAGITEEQCKAIVRDYITANRDTLKGDKGDTGADGRDGLSAYEIAKLNGFVGSEEAWLESLKGKDGRDGVDGENGKDGIDGTPGKDGSNGLSAYEVAKKNGFVGNEKTWLASLKGEKGDQGEQGLKGDTGAKGDKGNDGYTPQKNVDYFDGEKGDAGESGLPTMENVAGGVVNMALDANKFYLFTGACTQITLTLNPATGYAEYIFAFVTDSACVLNISNVIWDGGSAPTLEANKYYEVSILNNVAVISQGASA